MDKIKHLVSLNNNRTRSSDDNVKLLSQVANNRRIDLATKEGADELTKQ